MMPIAKKDWMTTPNIPRLEAPTSSFPANRNEYNPGQRKIVTKNKVGREDGNRCVLVWDSGDQGLFSM